MTFLAATALPWWAIALIAVASFLVFNLLVYLILVPHVVFHFTVYRNPKKRSRECTNKKDADQVRMFEEGVAWAESQGDRRLPIEIVHDGLNLKGEFIDFGAKKCAVILQGRTESLLYSYYFAKPYAELGYDILVVDLRAHGLSDGKYQTGGLKEAGDIVAWIDYVRERFHVESFLFHGICIGAATSVYAARLLEERGYPPVEKVVCDGLYATYFKMFERNFASFKKKAFPMLHLTFLLARIYAKADFFANRPIEAVGKLQCPILLIYSAEDVFCPREDGESIYREATNPKSRLLFLPKGRHSHVRSLNTEAYDGAIKEFVPA